MLVVVEVLLWAFEEKGLASLCHKAIEEFFSFLPSYLISLLYYYTKH